MIDLDAIGRDLELAYGHRLGRRRKRVRAGRVVGLTLLAATVFSAVAVASGIGPDLQLDPTKWSILGRGSVDEGRGAYVHAQSLKDGSHSTFMVEHDAGVDRYQAFLLHERTKEASGKTSPVPVRTEAGALCTAEQLRKAESVAITSLRSGGDAAVAVSAAFGNAPCRGLEYAVEQAGAVTTGLEPPSMLMPGAR